MNFQDKQGVTPGIGSNLLMPKSMLLYVSRQERIYLTCLVFVPKSFEPMRSYELMYREDSPFSVVSVVYINVSSIKPKIDDWKVKCSVSS